MGQARGKGSGRRAQIGIDRPVSLPPECFDLAFAFADEPEGHRLDASRRARTWQFSPENWRKRKAHQVVERATGEIGVDQLYVDVAWMGNGVEHGGSRHRVEDDTFDMGMAQ